MHAPQKTYHLITYGCQMNKSDSERIETILTECGLTEADHVRTADVVVVNACSVRQSAVDRIWGNVKELAKLKVQKPSLVTILTGCVLPADKPKFQTRFDAVIPIKEIKSLPQILHTITLHRHPEPRIGARGRPDSGSRNKKEKQVVISNEAEGGVEKSPPAPMLRRAGHIVRNERMTRSLGSARDDPEKPYNYFTNTPLTPISQNVVSNTYLNIRPRHVSRFSAFVPIMTGCNAFCTYCAVPYTRGPEENRDPVEIIQEVEDLVMQKNYREVTLLGQIINKYNVRATDAFLKFLEWYQAKHAIILSFLSDPAFLEKRIFKFHHLLETLALLPKKYWLRFMSSHPNWFTAELITTIRDIPNIPKHFHLPVQAGSDSVLLRMRRPYRIAQYLDFIHTIRTHLPSATITTDCIVGFCGETEEEFQETLKLFEAVRYDMAFTAQYSPRPNTYAFTHYQDDVPKSVKEEREQRLTEVLKRTALENNQRLVGTTLDVLIHQRKGADLYSGISENFKNIHVQSHRALSMGECVSVHVTEANPWSLKGETEV